MLTGNILSFASGMGIRFNETVQVRIIAADEPRIIRYKGVKMLAFDVEFKSCVFNINNRRNYIVDARNLTDTRNSRPELAKKCLPNITISKSTVNILEQTNRLYMFHLNNVTYKDKVGHLKRIRVKDLKVNGGQVTVKVGNKDFPHNKIEFPLYNQILGM